jgi:hypothetical protein
LRSPSSEGTGEITVLFTPDDQLKIAVPAEMHENYVIGDAAASGKATYGRFRRFAVTTDEQLQRSVQ